MVMHVLFCAQDSREQCEKIIMKMGLEVGDAELAKRLRMVRQILHCLPL